MKYPALLCCAATAQAASLISVPPSGWTAWAPRDEIAPRTFIDTVHYRTRARLAGHLRQLQCRRPTADGFTRRRESQRESGIVSRLTIGSRAQRTSSNQVIARLDWRKAYWQARRPTRLRLPDQTRWRVDASDPRCRRARGRQRRRRPTLSRQRTHGNTVVGRYFARRNRRAGFTACVGILREPAPERQPHRRREC